jgi:isopenicillin-N epimerase
VRDHNRRLVLTGRAHLCAALGIAPPAPAAMIGALAAVPLPADGTDRPAAAPALDPLQDHLFTAHAIEVPVIPWPRPHDRLIRISAMLYNQEEQYRHLATVLGEHLVRR